MMDRIDFEVVTAKGALKLTTPDRAIARRYLAEHAESFPGLEMYEVVHQAPIRRRIRTHLRVVA